MGLDITAYERIQLVVASETTYHDEDPEGAHEGDGFVNYRRGRDTGIYLRNDGFPERSDGLVPGWYAVLGETHRFRAGSYSGYGLWREALAQMVMGDGRKLDASPPQSGEDAETRWENSVALHLQPGPFYELVHFSDCEGFLGPATCAKLWMDFVTWEASAQEAFRGNPYGDHYVSRYREWTTAFAVAAGCLVHDDCILHPELGVACRAGRTLPDASPGEPRGGVVVFS